MHDHSHALRTYYGDDDDDDPNFFLNFFDHLNDFQCDEVIIGGDFNLVLDLDMDKKSGLAKTHTESIKH